MIEYILFAIGIFLLIKGAGFLVDSSSSMASKFGISKLAIGLTVVAFGTSLPELIVNVYASLKGTTDIAFGNIMGSNIANILLILGIGAIITTIKFKKSTIWKEIPFTLLAAVVFFLLCNKTAIDGIKNGYVTRTDGLIMLSFFLIFIYYIFELAKDRELDVVKDVEIKESSNLAIFLKLFGGVIALYLGGKWVVDGTVYAATQFGISQLLISSTIVAVGTSLPELVTSLVALKKKEMELSVGNIVGSNIFNIFFIIPAAAFIAPLGVPALINFDFAFLIAATLLLFSFMFAGEKHQLKRWQGVSFLAVYAAYIAFLIFRG